MGVTSVSGGPTNNIGSGAGTDAGKTTSDRTIKNGHDKENNSTNGSIIKPGNEGDAASTVSTDTIEIGASFNVSNYPHIDLSVTIRIIFRACLNIPYNTPVIAVFLKSHTPKKYTYSMDFNTNIVF